MDETQTGEVPAPTAPAPAEAAAAAPRPRKPRKPRPKALINENGCTGCEACITVCPVDCIVKIPNPAAHRADRDAGLATDRKSTRLNSSHLVISYAVFC